VLGIEAVGIVESAPDTRFEPGRKVAAIMGGMGRQFDGSYAEYTLVPESSVFPLETELDWATLGAIPEMFQTVLGSLTIGLEVQAGQILLIRGGTSSIGMTTARLAKDPVKGIRIKWTNLYSTCWVWVRGIWGSAINLY
jgi:NADPH:quinone reductase-like Zn-dependent oxidoreductase